MIGFALRYLWFVAGHTTGTLVVLLGATAVGVWAIYQGAGSTPGAFLPLLLLQMFAASTGFSRLANRGHYDPLFVRGIAGWRIAVAHWLVSGLPGMAAWYVVALAELTMSRSDAGIGFGAPGLVSLLLVTTVTWAVTLPLPQLSGGILWLLAIVLTVLSTTGESLLRSVLQPHAALTLGEALRTAGVFALCPFLLLDPPEAARESLGLSLLFDLGVCVLALAAGIFYITRRDYPCTVDQ